VNEIFASMRTSLLAGPLAEDITLNGQSARAFVHRNIELLGDYGQVVARRTEIEIPSETATAGATVVIGVQTYALDAEVSDDGLFSRFVLVRA